MTHVKTDWHSDLYLSSAEVRSLPSFVIPAVICPACGEEAATDDAHFEPVGLGGKREKQGPKQELGRLCHRRLHDYPWLYKLAITRDGRSVIRAKTEAGESVRTLAPIPEGVVEAHGWLFEREGER